MCTRMNELEKVVADLRSLKAMKEELESEIKSLENDVINYLNVNNKTSEVGANFSVKYTACERKTLDRARLEADLGSLVDYEKVSKYNRLTVK